LTGQSKNETLLVALGGNALIQTDQQGTVSEQMGNLVSPMRQIANLYRRYRIIITHGNGPQVGNLLLQQESCDAVSRQPLQILVAQTQGQIGYMIESTLDNELTKLDKDHQTPIVSLITYVVVDENDPAFQNPTKPVGPIFTREQADKLAYPTVKTAKGYRRIVPSPLPISIVERREIRRLMEQDFIVTCCGGGGIPVIRNDGSGVFSGIDAVIDKDLASSRLAIEVGVDIFLITTDVPGVALDFGTPKQKFLRRLSIKKADKYLKQGHFHPGSMAPKVQGALMFMKAGGKRAIITAMDDIEAAVAGEAGTEFSVCS
jgi:carbamate kinase